MFVWNFYDKNYKLEIMNFDSLIKFALSLNFQEVENTF